MKKFSALTPRELEVLEFLSEGLKTKEIAAELYISLHTVQSHVKNLKVKLEAKSMAHLVTQAFRLGLLNVDSQVLNLAA